MTLLDTLRRLEEEKHYTTAKATLIRAENVIDFSITIEGEYEIMKERQNDNSDTQRSP